MQRKFSPQVILLPLLGKQFPIGKNLQNGKLHRAAKPALCGAAVLCATPAQHSRSDLGVEIELPGTEFAVFQWLEPEFVFPIIFVVVLVFPLACFLTFLQLKGITHS